MNTLEVNKTTNQLQIFKNNEFGEVRTITDEEGNPLLCLADVCKILNLEDTNKVKSRLTHGVLTKGVWVQTGTKKDGTPALRNTEMTFITESNLYKVIFQSRKPEAEKFTEWVTSEVLPTIRKHGMYATDELLNNPDLGIKVFSALKEEKAKRQALELEAKKNKPKLIFADAVKTSKTSIAIGDLAKILYQNGNKNMGQKRLFKLLREEGYLIKKGQSKNMPTQKALEKGLFEIKESIANLPDGSQKITRTTKVTGTGQIHFINMFSKELQRS